MEKLSNVLKNGHIAKLRDGRIVLAIKSDTTVNSMSNYTFINENLKFDGHNYSESGIYNSSRYDDESKNDIVAVYKVELNSFESMRNKIKNFDEGQTQWGVEKVWETPKDIEIDFDTLLRAMDGNSILEWLLTPNEIAERVNKIIENPNSNGNEYFIDELKRNIPALKDVESFYIEREPGDRW